MSLHSLLTPLSRKATWHRSFKDSWWPQRVIRLPQRKVFGRIRSLLILIRASVLDLSWGHIQIWIILNIGGISSFCIRRSIWTFLIGSFRLNTPSFCIRIQIWPSDTLRQLLDGASFPSDRVLNNDFRRALFLLLGLRDGPDPFLGSLI